MKKNEKQKLVIFIFIDYIRNFGEMVTFEGRCESENVIVGKFQPNYLKSTHLKYIFNEK